MLKNDIEKTLQAHSPVPPEGFAERMDRKVISLMQQKEQAPVKKKSRYRKPVIALVAALVLCFVTAASRNLIIRPDTIRARETATPLVTALSEGKGEETDGEGEANARGTGLLKTLVPNDDSRAKIEYDWPELANSLVPVNASCEKQGIRWEMKAAAVKDDEALFVYTLKDLQGDRINAGTGILHWPDLTDDIGERDTGGKGGPVSFDEATGELLYAECIKYKSRILPEDRRVTVGFENLSIDNQTSVDLLPMLEQYGEKAETVDPPTLLPVFRDDGTYMRLVPDEEACKGVKVLDYTKPLNVPLAKDITLTGIGWVDDVLHVQLHYANNREGRFYTGITSPEFDFLYDSSIRWDENNDGVEEWVEFMSPDKLSGRQVSSLSAKIIENTGTVEDKWEVQLSLSDILAQDEANAGTGNEQEADVSFCLWRFFRDWILGNADSVADAFEHEWDGSPADFQQAAKEIMASGTPRGFKLHGISGKADDPVRTLDVTVQWDAEDGGYRYTRHALEIWLQMNRNGSYEYEINPEGFKNSQPAEAVPEEELTLVTEEAFLRDTMDAHMEEVAYDELTPIGLSMEKQGIRMEVVSGCRKGDNAYFLLTTQELSGEYSDYSCDPPHDLQTEDGTVYGHYIRLGINRTENKITWLYSVDLSKAPLAENNALRVGIEELDFKEEREVDLLPLLELDGRTEEGITLPENYPVFTIDGKRAEDGLKVLNDEGSLDIHLDGNTYLSAIGWIGDQLHVQLVEKNEKSPDPDYEYMHLFVNCSVTGKPYEEIRVDGSPVSWFNLQNETSREEYIFNCTPEDVDSMRLYGYGTIMRATLRDDWTVEVPLDLLPDLTAAEPADREEEAELPADDWTVALENKRPGLLKDLKPVNLHIIEQGIRMEVISALIRDQRLYVVFSAEDLEGGRLKADPVITLEPSLDYNTSSLIRLDYDTEKQKKVTCLKEFELVYPAEADQKIMLQFGGLGAREAKRVDLLPLLEKYGKDAAVTALPENTSLLAHDQLSISSADVLMYPEILDYTQPLEESMGGTLSLSGIGWIDNKLHVQFHDADPSSVRIDNTHYPSWSASADAEIGDGDERRVVEFDMLSWNSAGEHKGEWGEYVLDITPDEAERMTLYAYVTHIEKILNVACRFELPAGLVMAEWPWDADPETAAPAA